MTTAATTADWNGRSCVGITLAALGVCIAVLGQSSATQDDRRPWFNAKTRILSKTTRLVIHPEALPMIVELRGEDLHWRVTYPGADQQLHTADDLTIRDQIHLPCGSAVTVQFSSADYLYSFALPVLHIEQIAVPQMTFELQLAPLSPGNLSYAGNQFCGGPHGTLSGQITVESSEKFNDWMYELSKHQ